MNAGVLYGGLGRGVDLWSSPQTLQLLPTEIIFIDNRSDQISGRLPLEKMTISADEKGQNFTIRTAATGFLLNAPKILTRLISGLLFLFW